MTVPHCPVHGPMRKSQKGAGYFCPNKLEDGTYCTHKASAPAPPKPQAATVAPGSTIASGPDLRFQAAVEAVRAAARRHQGIVYDQGYDGTLETARTLYLEFLLPAAEGRLTQPGDVPDFS